MQLDNSQFKEKDSRVESKTFIEILQRIVSWIFEQVLMKLDKFLIESY